MNDESNATGTSPNPPPPRFVLRPGRRPVPDWVRKFLFCNPCYLASAALLLFGICRVSLDPDFLPEETAQLTFNFTALQCYEVLLVLTALVLGRRLIWYDAKLLVTMENLLVLVPFVLISQAALIDQSIVWLFSSAAAAFALARSGLAQRAVAALRFPTRLAGIGLAVLLVNSAWPVVYRLLHEDKFGTKLESGGAFWVHVAGWWVLLPALFALANLLPRPLAGGEALASGRRFPVGLYSLWMLGTVTHLYALGYVYDFDLRRAWVAPAGWVLAWTLHFRLPDYGNARAPLMHKLTLILPLPAALVATGDAGSNVVFVLGGLNLLIFAVMAWRQRGQRMPLHLALTSAAIALAALPMPLLQFLNERLTRDDLLGIAVLGYAMVMTLLTRQPKAALVGALAAAAAGGAWRDDAGDVWHWAAQSGLVFFLVHSLRWRDYEHPEAFGVRTLMAVGWVLHSLVWVRLESLVWSPMVLAGFVLGFCCLRGFLLMHWMPRVVPLAALTVMLCGPLNLFWLRLQTAPVGLVAIAGSFLLFALGTAAALTKHRWHRG